MICKIMNILCATKCFEIIVFIVTYVICTAAQLSPDLSFSVERVCDSSATFRWTVDPANSLHNCSVDLVNPPSLISDHRYKSYLVLPFNGTFRLENLKLQRQYSLQIKCLEVSSDPVTFITEKCQQQDSSQNGTQSDVSSVVVYKEQSAFSVENRDSVLGIVFGLCGIVIIVVTCFYAWKKFRRRRRLERIRSYLGASLIDPFENLQSRVDDSSSRRLMGSSESLS